MKKWLFRVLGALLIAGALAGMLMSITGIIFVWRIKPVVDEKLASGLDLAERSLVATSGLISAIDSSLDNTLGSLENLENVTTDAAGTLENTIPVIDSLGDFFGEDLSSVLHETKTSLDEAESSAKMVDDTLGLLTSVMSLNPFSSTPAYAPEVPLQTSISQVSDQLARLPESLNEIESGLGDSTESLQELQKHLEKTAKSVTEMKNSVEEAQKNLSDYPPILDEMKLTVEKARGYLILSTNTAAWGITILLLWLVVAQIGLFTQGIEIVSGFKTGAGL